MDVSAPNNSSRASDIPPELLDRIFKICERYYKRYSYSYGEILLPKSRMYPLLLVCRTWRPVAEHRLYKSISIGSNRTVRDRNGQKMEIVGKEVCRKLCETVQGNPRIASLVRELHMGSLNVDREESELHVRLIGICKNVDEIELYGCHEALLEDLAQVLAKADLVSLRLWHERLKSFGSDQKLFSLSTLMKLLPNWPRLEKLFVRLARVEYGPFHEAELAGSHPTPGTCAALRNISIHGVSFNAAQLKQLADICPNLEEISSSIRYDCDEALRHCVQVWSSSLKVCAIQVFAPSREGPHAFPDNTSPVVSFPLIEIRELSMPSPLLTPSAMKFLPNVEKLGFRGEYHHGMELAKIIENGGMPRLRELNAFYNSDYREAIDDRLERGIAKETRRVCEERNIYVLDILSRNDEIGPPRVNDYSELRPDSPDNDWHDGHRLGTVKYM
ncbi:hypothetical protein SCHPADRAFT_931592 [Schizopora paradoxa]|uniref:Uncharacterized protein n=1 Tax=Schizopora paradoxa TaxID=27342 RepID=A0A0H2RA76_9AGAM|nr:hypothetical protein SCHPADRAFT_931592 [Schizopora paradoxa]